MAVIKQISIKQPSGTYISNDIGANAANVDIDANNTLAEKAVEWDDKVDSETGKGLSTNDYTDNDKDKLDDIEEGAEVNVIESVSVNGTAQSITNKNVDIIVPSADTMAPKNHASTQTTYGVATSENYGHVKFGNSAGTAVEGNDSRLSDARTPVAHATNADTYGLGTASVYGHVKVVNAINSRSTDASAAASAQSVYDALINLANVFDPEELYEVGDYLIYNGVFYKCTTAHTGAWDAEDFERTLVSDNFGSGGGGTKSTLTVTTPLSGLYGATITVSIAGGETLTGIFSNTGESSFSLSYVGVYTITCESYTETINNSTLGSVLTAALAPALVAWPSGTDAQISNMVEAYYNGYYSLNDIKSVWSIGDSRNVDLSAMLATGVGEQHRAQTVEMVIIGFDHDTLTTPINNKTKALITVQMKNCLRDASVSDTGGSSNTEHGYMNSSNTNVNGWRGCARRTWCNNVFYTALSSGFKALVKQANHSTTVGNQGTSLETTADYCFLPSEWEIFGAKTYAAAQEGTQYEYYKTAANRYKLPKWNSSVVSDIWWERSPGGSDTTNFCTVYRNGNADSYGASYANGLAPAACI